MNEIKIAGIIFIILLGGNYIFWLTSIIGWIITGIAKQKKKENIWEEVWGHISSNVYCLLCDTIISMLIFHIAFQIGIYVQSQKIVKELKEEQISANELTIEENTINDNQIENYENLVYNTNN
jgi:hypothetical protein